jgi:HEAT repeat protein
MRMPRKLVFLTVGLAMVCAPLVREVSAQSAKDVRKVARQGPDSLPELQRFLLNPDVKVRLQAVESIIEIGGPRTLDPLVEATRDNDAQVQIPAVNGLVNFYMPGYVRTGLTAPIRKIGWDIRSRFSDPDDQVIDPYIVVRPGVVQAIARVARSGSSLDSRANAARAAGVLRGKIAVPDLVEALRSRDSDVILESLVALEKIRDSSACSGVHYLIRDLDEKVQTEAIETNGVLNCRGAKPDLIEVLRRTTNARVRRGALTAIALMPDPSDRELFGSFLDSPDERLRASAAEGFARLANIEDARRLQAAFDQESRNAPRLALAFALVMDGNLSLSEYAPLRYLIYSLNNNAFRDAARAYLTEASRNPEVRRALYASLDDGTRDEKVNLARVIAASGDKTSVPTLEKLSHDTDSLVAGEGVRQLRNLQARL